MAETMSGEQAWEAVRERVMAVEQVPGRLPHWRFQQSRTGLKAELAGIGARRGELGGVWAADHTARFEGLLRSVEALSLAGVWGQTQLAHQTSARTVQEAVDRVMGLRQRGFRGLGVLESVGVVPREEAVRIRQGTGFVDAASDLQALAPLLRAHWALLEPVQAHVPDEELRLTPELIDAMPQAAADLIGADRGHHAPAGEVDWYDALRRMAVLLEGDWNQLRAMTSGALAALGEVDAALTVRPSVLALDRRG